MALTNSQYKSVIRDYEHTRDTNRALSAARREEVYSAVPGYRDPSTAFPLPANMAVQEENIELDAIGIWRNPSAACPLPAPAACWTAMRVRWTSFIGIWPPSPTARNGCWRNTASLPIIWNRCMAAPIARIRVTSPPRRV